MGLHLSISKALGYSLAQVASIHGLIDEEKGRGGHREELTIAETPVFSTFLQTALRVWVPSPQVVEHWWGKKGQVHVSAAHYRLMGFCMSSHTHQNMRKVVWKRNSHLEKYLLLDDVERHVYNVATFYSKVSCRYFTGFTYMASALEYRVRESCVHL